MSTHFGGVKLNGLRVSARKEFTSFPGLELWVDPRTSSVSLHLATARVKSITERSRNGFVFTQLVDGNRLDLLSTGAFKYLHSQNQNFLSQVNNGLYPRLNFLRDGSSFSVYFIERMNTGATGGSNYFKPLYQAGSAWEPSHGVSNANRTVEILSTFLNGGGGVAGQYTYGTWYITELLCRGYLGAGVDYEVYMNGVSKITINFSGDPTALTWGGGTLAHWNGLGSGDIALVLAYNHTGKSDVVRDQERAEIYALIQELYTGLL